MTTAIHMPADYTRLTCHDIAQELRDTAREVQLVFGPLDVHALNWRPDATRWSAAQCFEHLVTANRLMHRAAHETLGGAPVSIWQRLPILPGLFGSMLIRSQAPSATRKFVAPAVAQPSASDVKPDVIQHFVQQQLEAAQFVEVLDERRAARAIMTSPFIRVVTYSVLDGCRLVVAHNHRHVEQARRVTQSPGFPGARETA